jgi:hypothetical protein
MVTITFYLVDVGMVNQPIYRRGCHHVIAKYAVPFTEGLIRGN